MNENLDKEFAKVLERQNLSSLFEQKTAGVWRCEKFNLDVYPSRDWARNYKTGEAFDTVKKAMHFIMQQFDLPSVPSRPKPKYSIGDVLFQTWEDVSRAIEKARKRAKGRFANKNLIIGENYESDPNPISHS